ncbi:hypothetical protein Bbad01_13960 [Bacillus badius]|nr:hypothetical protein Bbad01_13960 [Bacillus badius]
MLGANTAGKHETPQKQFKSTVIQTLVRLNVGPVIVRRQSSPCPGGTIKSLAAGPNVISSAHNNSNTAQQFSVSTDETLKKVVVIA